MALRDQIEVGFVAREYLYFESCIPLTATNSSDSRFVLTRLICQYQDQKRFAVLVPYTAWYRDEYPSTLPKQYPDSYSTRPLNQLSNPLVPSRSHTLLGGTRKLRNTCQHSHYRI